MESVAIAQSGRKRFQDQNSTAFSSRISVGLRAEAVASAGRRQHRGFGEADKGIRAEDDIDAGRQRHRALPAAQALASLVQRDQCGRAGGIHRHAGASQIEDIGDAVGGDGKRASNVCVGADQFRRAMLKL